MKPCYKRVLVKLSGEALSAGSDGIFNYDFIDEVCRVIKKCVDIGTQVSIVVGAGNIWRGRQGVNMDRTRADHMGMLATVINCLALQDALEKLGVDTRVMTAVEMQRFAEPYIRNKAVSHLNKGRVVIFGCGIGSPFFSTDTTAALRAAEIEAEVILMAKNIDAVYSADPKSNPDAVRYSELTHAEVLEKDLKVMDATAAALCRDNKIAIHVFGLAEENGMMRAIRGESIGTIVK